MASQLPSSLAKQQSIARRPITRKAVTDAARQNQPIGPIGNITIAGLPGPCSPSNNAHELQGSLVSSLPTSNQALALESNVAESAAGPKPLPDMAGSEATGHATEVATNSPTPSNR